MPRKSYLSKQTLRRRGRAHWFVRLAEKGFVPAPCSPYGSHKLIAACPPELFDNPHQVTRCRQRNRRDLLAQTGFNHCTRMKLRLPDLKRAMPVRVNAPTPRTAPDLLKPVLPEGSKVEEG